MLAQRRTHQAAGKTISRGGKSTSNDRFLQVIYKSKPPFPRVSPRSNVTTHHLEVLACAKATFSQKATHCRVIEFRALGTVAGSHAGSVKPSTGCARPTRKPSADPGRCSSTAVGGQAETLSPVVGRRDAKTGVAGGNFGVAIHKGPLHCGSLRARGRPTWS